MYFYNVSAMRRHRNGQYYDVPTGFLVGVAVTGLLVIGLPIGGAIYATVREEQQKTNVYNSITITNGEEVRVDNIEGEERNKDLVKIMRPDDSSLVVYVYKKDETERYLYTEFVESNIYVIEEENGEYKIILNKDDLTEEKYQAFVSTYEENNDESRIQRKRS